MANDKGFIGSGSSGDTSGTGRPRPSEGGEREDLNAAPAAADASEGGVNAAGPGPTGGKLSSEGTGGEPFAPDAGSPGGMGGATAPAGGATSGHRPPGGVSPVPPEESGD